MRALFFGSLSENDADIGRVLTSQNESETARKLQRPVGHLRVTDKVHFRGYNWRGSSTPHAPVMQHMVDAVYDVLHETEVVELSVRSWSGSIGFRTLDDSFGFDSLVAVHATDFLHSASSVPIEVARTLTERSLSTGGNAANLGKIVVGDVRCELRFEHGAVITIAIRPSTLQLADLQVELFVTAG